MKSYTTRNSSRLAGVSVILSVVFTVGFIFALAGHCHAQGVRSIVFPYRYMKEIDEDEKIEEPSGIVYNPKKGTLFVVSDEGVVYETNFEGKIYSRLNITRGKKGVDLEGITVNPYTGDLFILAEKERAVYVADSRTMKVKKIFKIHAHHKGKQLFSKKGSGFEGVTYVPAWGKRPAALYICNQEYPPRILVVELPKKIEDAPDMLMVSSFIDMPFSDLSGICFNHARGTLFVISDWNNLLVEMSVDGRIIRQFALPGEGQEGIAFVGDRVMYIAQDSGKILKFIFHPSMYPETFRTKKKVLEQTQSGVR